MKRRLRLASVVVLAVAFAASAQSKPARIVSLVPALTDMLVAIGAHPQLVAVSSYDFAPEVKDLPRVGALLDPDVERIISLRPDLVLVYGSQQDVMAQLARAKIPVFDYRHGGLDHITTTIRTLGERTGRASPAQQLASDIEQRIRALRAKTSSLRKPRTLLVFGRERGALRGIYASGGRGFLHEMLDAAGGVNVFADVQAESVQASSEMVLARAPEAILEIRSADLEREQDLSVWKTLSSLPAVRDNRIHLLAGQSVVVPGPLVTDGIERMARALHPALFK